MYILNLQTYDKIHFRTFAKGYDIIFLKIFCNGGRNNHLTRSYFVNNNMRMFQCEACMIHTYCRFRSEVFWEITCLNEYCTHSRQRTEFEAKLSKSFTIYEFVSILHLIDKSGVPIISGVSPAITVRSYVWPYREVVNFVQNVRPLQNYLLRHSDFNFEYFNGL